VSTESELSTDDLARSGQGRQEERRTPEPRGERAPEASEEPAARPLGDEREASGEGQHAREGYPQEGVAADPRAGATAEPAPDSLGGGAGDQDSMTRPGGPEGGALAAEPSAPGAEAGGVPSAPRHDRPGGEVALLGPADEDRFRQRWGDAQARFVDDPQDAVRTADGLVAELMQSLAQGFSEHKARLEAQWQRGGDPDTEELRQALQRYRSFFDRLLST
jgi:hypothetical protein